MYSGDFRKNMHLVICGALVFGVAFLLHYHYLLNMFYHSGAPYNDAGIMAQIAWRSDWKLTPPLVYTNYSFYGVHFIPIFTFLTGISYLVNTHLAEFYSTFIAGIYASLGLVLFTLINIFIRLRNPLEIAAVGLLSLLFAFHTIIMNGIWIGHYEYAISLMIIVFLTCYLFGHKWHTLLALIVLLFIREDAGFHLAAVLGLVGLLRFWETRNLRAVKREAGFVIAAIAYSALAMWLSLAARGFFPGSTFEIIYSGTPAYAHLSFSMLAERLVVISKEHVYLWTGFLLTLVVAWRARNPYMMIGFAAYIPWFLINWLAFNGRTGELHAYYAFPFLVSAAWPLFGVVFRYGFPLPQTAIRQAFELQIGLVLLGAVMWNSGENNPEFGPYFGARWGDFSVQKGLENRAQVRDFIEKFRGGAGNLGTVMVDDGVLSLMKDNVYQGQGLLRPDSDKPANTLIYMFSTHPVMKAKNLEILDKAKKNRMPNHYCMPDTTICMYTSRNPAQLGLLLAFFVERAAPSEQKNE